MSNLSGKLALALAVIIMLYLLYLIARWGSPQEPQRDLVWFGPSLGSEDYAALFTRPERWPMARSKIDVFTFYTGNVLPYDCSVCEGNTLGTFVEAGAFKQLTQWDIAIAVEVGAVKPWGCDGREPFRVVEEVVRNVQANGGTVSYLVMDEPLLTGLHEEPANTCNYTLAETAENTAWFVKQIRAKYPGIIVGDNEPYPGYAFSVEKLEEWIMTLEANGATPAFFHLDVDLVDVRRQRLNLAEDLKALNQFCEAHGIPFGVIFISTWTQAGSDKAYYESAMELVEAVNAAIGKPPHVIFQSWWGLEIGVTPVPINLPENEPAIFSHTRLVIDGLAVFGR